jgi:hypothetical protein
VLALILYVKTFPTVNYCSVKPVILRTRGRGFCFLLTWECFIINRCCEGQKILLSPREQHVRAQIIEQVDLKGRYMQRRARCLNSTWKHNYYDKEKPHRVEQPNQGSLPLQPLVKPPERLTTLLFSKHLALTKIGVLNEADHSLPSASGLS